jgi:hypothetical protein
MKNIIENIIIICVLIFTIFCSTTVLIGQETFGVSRITNTPSTGGAQMEITIQSDTLTGIIYLPNVEEIDSTTRRYGATAVEYKYFIYTTVTVNKIGGETKYHKVYFVFGNNSSTIRVSGGRTKEEIAYGINGAKLSFGLRYTKVHYKGRSFTKMKTRDKEKPVCFY